MILGIDYIIRSDMEYDTLPIEILIPKYKGIIIAFKTIQILEGQSEAIIRFDYDILNETEKFTKDQLKEDPIFKETLGLILNAMILSVVDSENNSKFDE